MAVKQGHRVFAFTKPGDTRGQAFAKSLGAVWAGGSDEAPPEKLDAAIIFAPVGALVPVALKSVRKAGAVVCAGIHMSDIPAFPYACCGRSGRSPRSPISRDATASNFCAWRRNWGSGRKSRVIRSSTPIARLPICARARFDGAAVLIP